MRRNPIRSNARLLVVILLLASSRHVLSEPTEPARDGSAAAQPAELQHTGFAGKWNTTFGPLELVIEDGNASGTYLMGADRCTVRGTLNGNRMEFAYREPNAAGEGWFELAADGQSFRGRWRQAGQTAWFAWTGHRAAETAESFDGLWETSYGRLRLIQDGAAARGRYAYAGGSTLSGQLMGRRFEFTYREPDAEGQGWFELSSDGRSFAGQWKENGSEAWQPWTGERIEARPGLVWLVVLEAHWEASLADDEYSFGSMLRAFFARTPHVQVRHRFFQNAETFRRWCNELAWLPEPVVLVIASHGNGQGVTADGQTIDAATIGDCLRDAGNLQLLHFSACEIMAGDAPRVIREQAGAGSRFPISGYAATVDWAASAVIEFTYLDLILARRLSPASAAEQVQQLLPFAGDEPIPGTAIPPARFRIAASGVPLSDSDDAERVP